MVDIKSEIIVAKNTPPSPIILANQIDKTILVMAPITGTNLK